MLRREAAVDHRLDSALQCGVWPLVQERCPRRVRDRVRSRQSGPKARRLLLQAGTFLPGATKSVPREDCPLPGRKYWFVAASMFAAMLAAPLRADVPPPEEFECRGVALGAACSEGTCQNGTCRRTNYAGWNRDASSTPPTTSYACVLCLAAGEADAAIDADGSAGGKAPDKKDTGCTLGAASAGGNTGLACVAAAAALAIRHRRRRR